MALIMQWTDEQKADWQTWLESRPEKVRKLAEQFPPDRLYRLRGDDGANWRVTVIAYSEEGTLRVAVTGRYNRVLFSRAVFGIKPDDLEECDLPVPDEDLGDTAAEAGYSDEDIREILIPQIMERQGS